MIKEPDIDAALKQELIDKYVQEHAVGCSPTVSLKIMEHGKVIAKEDIGSNNMSNESDTNMIEKSGVLAPNHILEAIGEKVEAEQKAKEAYDIMLFNKTMQHEKDRESNRNRNLAMRVISVMNGDTSRGLLLNSFESELVALCKTQL